MEFFGPLDELDVPEQLSDKLHVELDFEEIIKIGPKSTGKCVAVAPKGFGKTHFRRFTEESSEEDTILVQFNEKGNVFDPDIVETKLHSGRLKSAIQVYLLTKVASLIPPSRNITWESLQKNVEDGVKKVKSAGEAISKIDVNLGPAKISLGGLFSNSGGISNKSLTPLSDAFKKDLGEANMLVTIDDLEEVFPGIEQSPDFIEGLIRGCSELNRVFGEQVHFVVFMKFGLWRILNENRREYDKIKNQFAFLSWNEFHFKQLIAKRIQVFRLDEFDEEIDYRDEESIFKAWNTFFSLGDKRLWSRRVRELFSICRSGPRDLIFICNEAHERKTGDRISWGDIERALPLFSADKLKDICAEHCEEFPDAELFVKHIFEERLDGLNYSNLHKRVSAIAGDNHAANTLRDHKWFSSRNTSDKIKVMYDIGIIGVGSGKKVNYSFDGRDISSSELRTSDIVMHPAFNHTLLAP